jgi:hypothetical protein
MYRLIFDCGPFRETEIERKLLIIQRGLESELAEITLNTDESDPESVRSAGKRCTELKDSADKIMVDLRSALEDLKGEEILFKKQEARSWDQTARILCSERLWLKKVSVFCNFFLMTSQFYSSSFFDVQEALPKKKTASDESLSSSSQQLMFNHLLFQRFVKVFLIGEEEGGEPKEFLLLQISIYQHGLDLEFVAYNPIDSRTVPVPFNAAAGNKLAEEFKIMEKEERDINIMMMVNTLEITAAYENGKFDIRFATID